MEEQNEKDNRTPTYSNIWYYGRNDQQYKKIELLCPQQMGDNLIIDDNTIYEIDPECYKRMQMKKK